MRRKSFFATIFMFIIIVCLVGCGKGRTLSNKIVGKWKGKLDVASILSYELSREMGINEKIFSPDPVYSDIQIVFNKDLSGELIIDQKSFTKAVEKVIEPYISILVGFDTNNIVDLLFETALQDMDPDTGTAFFTYEVDDKEDEVYLKFDDGNEGKMQYSNGKLEFETDVMDTRLVFKK